MKCWLESDISCQRRHLGDQTCQMPLSIKIRRCEIRRSFLSISHPVVLVCIRSFLLLCVCHKCRHLFLPQPIVRPDDRTTQMRMTKYQKAESLSRPKLSKCLYWKINTARLSSAQLARKGIRKSDKKESACNLTHLQLE